MIMVLIGTRPEVIKMSPVIRELQRQQVPFRLIHSNQHYSADLDSIFFHELQLPAPDVQLGVGSGSHAQQTGQIMARFEAICLEQKPELVLVHGDTNTTLAGALAAKKIGLPVGHVEAGLRSYDDTMPEEINRKIVDRIADLLFVPTLQNSENLRREGIAGPQVIVTGNTIVDAVLQNREIAHQNQKPLDYPSCILLTAHRPHNVDNPDRLAQLFQVITEVSTQLNLPVVWPMHPRTQQTIKKHQLKLPTSVKVLEPIGYLEMLRYLEAAELVMTDSGGIQEEAYVLHRPLLTLRENTERPETLSANQLVGLDVVAAEAGLAFFSSGQAKWGNELGDGQASQKIVSAIQKFLGAA